MNRQGPLLRAVLILCAVLIGAWFAFVAQQPDATGALGLTPDDTDAS